EAPKKLQCITHDLKTVVCSWDADLDNSLGTAYEFCRLKLNKDQCSEVGGNTSSTFDLVLFDIVTVNITAKNAHGSASKIFSVKNSDITFISPTPQILGVTPDFPSNTLIVEWNVSALELTEKMKIIWTVSDLGGGALVTAANTPHNTLAAVPEQTFHWDWTSDIPLECTSHSVRIRSSVNVYFPGPTNWSEWSPLKTVKGKDVQPETKNSVYPTDKIVKAGSNVTFCCIADSKHKVKSLSLGAEVYSHIELSNHSSAITVYNIEVSEPSGSNVVCYLEPFAIAGTVVFVGYPPDVPQDLTCETRDLLTMSCTWNRGRPTSLYGDRKTVYTLEERFSGKTCVREPAGPDSSKYQCDIHLADSQATYNFTLTAKNSLGRTESLIAGNVTHTVYPVAPTDLFENDVSPTSFDIYWSLKANYTPVGLLCQIKLIRSDVQVEVFNTSKAGGPSETRYQFTVDSLQPDTLYSCRIRCAVSPYFWKWSEWSAEQKIKTSEAHTAPSEGPNIWRKITGPSENRSVTIYWEPLSQSEANGEIEFYDVSWAKQGETLLLQTIAISAVNNSAQIQIDRNKYIINVTARNFAGSSPPSVLGIVEYEVKNIEVKQATGTGDGVNLYWQPDDNVTCGYVVEWYILCESQNCKLQWEKFTSNMTNTVIKSDAFKQGVRYNFFVYGCEEDGHHLLEEIVGYTAQLAPRVGPSLSAQQPTSDSAQLTWDTIPVKDQRGFLKGYIIYYSKNVSTWLKFLLIVSSHKVLPDSKMLNITDPTVRSTKITDLQSGTRYKVVLHAYTTVGKSPEKITFFITENAPPVTLILAIVIPVAVAVLLAILMAIMCYRKGKWIKDVFYPDIPNLENCKALQFYQDICKENTVSKTMEMNPCTPSRVEVVENTDPAGKIDNSEFANDQLPEDGSDTDTEKTWVIPYYPQIIEEESSNQSNTVLSSSQSNSSQVIYSGIKNLGYQPQVGSEEMQENNCFVNDQGYKPQVHTSNGALNAEHCASLNNESVKSLGYQPQGSFASHKLESPGSPTSNGHDDSSENTVIGSPCSVNSTHFLLPSEDKEPSKSVDRVWSFSSFVSKN
uniref:Fibronectin type-III domain-containing protein n=1 Tax=Latimeria chalumnae TaxID=7897 RepID=H3A6T2_LATCH